MSARVVNLLLLKHKTTQFHSCIRLGSISLYMGNVHESSGVLQIWA